MSAKSKLGLEVLGAGVAMGLLADALLRQGPWGLNFLIWIAVLVLAVLALANENRIGLAGGGRWLVIPAVLFAATFAVRDSFILKLLSFAAVSVCMALVTIRARTGSVRVSSILQYVLGFVMTSIAAFIGVPLLALGDVQWKEVAGGGRASRGFAVARGILFAVPPLIAFTALLMRADAVFEGFIKSVFYMDFSTWLSHLFLVAFFGWATTGYFRGVLFDWDVPVTVGAQSRTFGIGIIETGVILATLDLLFFSFVAVQFRYLFGGHALVQATTGLTYAEYARRGFFELVAVAALVLPLLLGLHWLLRKDHPSHERVFQALAGIQILLLFVIMASAAERMRMYQIEYGLTELRVYTTTFIIWLAVVFLWFAATVLRGHRERFIFGAMVTGFAAIAGLHVINPDALIVRTNTTRIEQGRNFDAHYAARLSADTVPELIAALPRLNRDDQCTVASGILRRWSLETRRDWRTWSFSRARAWQAVSQSKVALEGMKSGCPPQSKPNSD